MDTILEWIEGLLHIAVPIIGIATVINDYSTQNLLLLLILLMVWGLFSFRKS
jgi:hypothetical protein